MRDVPACTLRAMPGSATATLRRTLSRLVGLVRWGWVLAVLLVLAGCGGARLGAPDPVTREGDRILSLWRGAAITGLAVGALVWGLIVFSVVRYRRRDDRLPSQGHENLVLEVAYTSIPVLIVAALFAFTVATQSRVTDTVADPDLVVEVVGFQWQWQFRYPDQGVTVVGTPEGDPPTMVLPVGRTTRLRLVTTDVIHSFWVPRFLEKRDLIPGVDNELDVRPHETGSWVGRCAEFCGLDHYRMNFGVRAVPEDEFRAWVAERRGAP